MYKNNSTQIPSFNQDLLEECNSSIKLTARNNCFERIQSILVNTNIEKPPNDVLADILDGFSIF